MSLTLWPIKDPNLFICYHLLDQKSKDGREWAKERRNEKEIKEEIDRGVEVERRKKGRKVQKEEEVGRGKKLIFW